jgi:hypothetical protein
MTRFDANASTRRLDVDVKGWLDMLGFSSLPSAITPQFAYDVGRRALRIPDLVLPNSICHWLGGNDADTVRQRLAHHHVELATSTSYNNWLQKEWGIESQTRQNTSTQYLSLSTLNHDDLVYISELSLEDQKLYNAIENRLTQSGQPSITGEDLL